MRKDTGIHFDPMVFEAYEASMGSIQQVCEVCKEV
jgi:hypothetical protein